MDWKEGFAVLIVAATLVLMFWADVGNGEDSKRRPPANADPRWSDRMDMVENQIVSRGIKDPRVLDAMRSVQRHRFVPAALESEAYDDHPLPIAEGQTISQPYIVAIMTELLELEPDDKVLEVGTGSGYQAAVLSEIVGQVFSIEIVEELADSAAKILEILGYENVTVRAGDGYQGWPGEDPFDAIIVTAAPEQIPAPLLQQLAEGGRLVIPVGGYSQELIQVRKENGVLKRRAIIPVRFVPMTGEAESMKR